MFLICSFVFSFDCMNIKEFYNFVDCEDVGPSYILVNEHLFLFGVFSRLVFDPKERSSSTLQRFDFHISKSPFR